MTRGEAPREIWLLYIPAPGTAGGVARLAEQAGFDGLCFADTQCLAADVYTALALAAAHSERLRLATGVTNPVTRHPAVTAGAIATLQVESGGRAVLGMGRGDSSLAHLGREPVPVAEFERYLRAVQGYLGGEAVDQDGHPSRLEWLAETGMPKVPVDVAATGPRMIGLAARLAERVSFAVGAEPERVRQAIETARRAREQAGLDPAEVSLGAYVNVVCHPDAARARELARGGMASFARFSAMHGKAVGGVPEADRAQVERLGRGYVMAEHGMRESEHARSLDPAFIDRFAVAGPPEHCRQRLGELFELGLERILVVPGSRDPALRGELMEALQRLAAEVLPALRPSPAGAGGLSAR